MDFLPHHRVRTWSKLLLFAGFVIAVTACAAFAASGPMQPSPTTAEDSFVFTAAGDFGMSDDASATLAGMAQSDASFHLALGDLSYSPTFPESDWCDYVQSHVGDVPFQLVPGNHEDDYGEDGHISRFADCLPDHMASTGNYPEQYYFDYQDLARFIVISPDLTINGQHYYYGEQNPEYLQYHWLANVVDDARAVGIPWIVVAMHKNWHSIAVYYCNVYDDLLNLLVDRRVDLVLHAHDHSYQRGKQLAHSDGCAWVPVDIFDASCVADDGSDNEYLKGAGMVFAVVGSAGAELYDVDPSDPEAEYLVTWMGNNANPRKGFLQVTVSASELHAEFVGTTPTSSFTDAFRITVSN